MVAAPRFTPELFICRAYERGCLPCEETAAALIFRGTESAGGFCTHLLATEHQEKDALEGMQDQRWSSIAHTAPRRGRPITVPGWRCPGTEGVTESGRCH